MKNWSPEARVLLAPSAAFRTLAAEPSSGGAWASLRRPLLLLLVMAEMCHPAICVMEDGQEQIEQFAARAPVTAIGSSDFHGLGPMGLCRTYVFAADATEQAIPDAARAHRTVMFGKDGRA